LIGGFNVADQGGGAGPSFHFSTRVKVWVLKFSHNLRT
jgi:hypothetical protein